jgi:hypothetical protein
MARCVGHRERDAGPAKNRSFTGLVELAREGGAPAVSGAAG